MFIRSIIPKKYLYIAKDERNYAVFDNNINWGTLN